MLYGIITWSTELQQPLLALGLFVLGLVLLAAGRQLSRFSERGGKNAPMSDSRFWRKRGPLMDRKGRVYSRYVPASEDLFRP